MADANEMYRELQRQLDAEVARIKRAAYRAGVDADAIEEVIDELLRDVDTIEHHRPNEAKALRALLKENKVKRG